MIESFLESWPLLRESYLVGWLAMVLLSMVGVLVVARDQIFIGAAVSQASTLGIAIALAASTLPGVHELEWMHEPLFLSACSVAFSVLAALLTSPREAAGQTTHEAVTGWIFLAGASISVLVVSGSAHGMEEVQRIMSSGIYGASPAEVWLFASMVLVVGLLLLAVRRRALLLLTDEEMARAIGMRTGVWRIGFACLLGVVVGISLRTVGMLYTFGALVLPCLAARNLCRRSVTMLVVGPALGLSIAVSGFVLSHGWDQPPGQMTVALLCVLVALTGLLRRAVRR
jgi:ABC-type Mn2+/Zn2+ transport system permease subunit